MPAAGRTTNRLFSAAAIAWTVASLFYFYQYVLRAAPSVMMPQLGETFGLTAAGLAALLGLFYYGYAPFSLVAGVTIDQFEREGGRLHPHPTLNQQGIAELAAQPLQRVTDRRLRPSEPFGRTGDAALDHENFEHDQQVKIETA